MHHLRRKRGFGKARKPRPQDIVYTVITRLELTKLKAEVEKIDPGGLYGDEYAEGYEGGMVKKRPLAHSRGRGFF